MSFSKRAAGASIAQECGLVAALKSKPSRRASKVGKATRLSGHPKICIERLILGLFTRTQRINLQGLALSRESNKLKKCRSGEILAAKFSEFIYLSSVLLDLFTLRYSLALRYSLIQQYSSDLRYSTSSPYDSSLPRDVGK